MHNQRIWEEGRFNTWTRVVPAVLWALIVWLLPSMANAAESLTNSHIAIIYPEIGEPYRNVFLRMIEGIEDQVKSTVPSYAVNANSNSLSLANELRRQDTRIVIALGRQGLRVANTLGRDLGIIAGGVISVPEAEARDFLISSLAPDPGLLLTRLKNLAPNIRRVLVVYDPRQNGWLIRLAKEAALNRGLELVAYEANDLKSALRIYNDIMLATDARKDALWLLQDSTTVEETSVLPLVLQESWNRNLLVFSSNVNHVKRGVLFALYPDNLELGRSLGNLALRQLASGNYRNTPGISTGMNALKDVLSAINIRTASHLGLNLESKRQSFDLIFPEQ